jgi:glycosyltransferase involved in cell wall biosynthesis
MPRREIFMFGFRGFPGVQGGIETHVENLAPRLAQLGHAVTACMRSPYVSPGLETEWQKVRRVRLWTVRNTYLETLLHALVCAIVAGLRRPEIVHIHGIGSSHVVPLLRLLGLKVVVTHHSEDYKREKWGWAARTMLQTGEVLGMRFANRRIAVSPNISELVNARYGKTCAFIPNGVAFPDLPEETDKIREFGLEPGRYILTVGRITPEKRQLDVVRAFSRARLAGWKLAIVGGSDHKSKYADLLAMEARLAGDVVMTGIQTGEALRQLYGHAGLFVLASSHEGLPIALLEALSYGVPVLVSDIPPNRQVVEEPTRIFAVGDISELSARLSAVVDVRLDPAQRDILRAHSIRPYQWAEIARTTSAIYNELACGERGARGAMKRDHQTGRSPA